MYWHCGTESLHYTINVLNIPPSGVVRELLNRAGGRVELLVVFTAAKGYELVDWNRAAGELFDLDVAGRGHPRLSWAELPASLAEYLSQALQVVSGAPEEAMPGFKHPTKPDRNYFAKVFYEGVSATAEREDQHWHFFCFQDSVTW